MDNWTTADWIGFYGAIVATISIGWQIIWAIFNNRSKLKIKTSYGLLPDKKGHLEPTIIATIKLIGDKPITVLSVAISNNSNTPFREMMPLHERPIMLIPVC